MTPRTPQAKPKRQNENHKKTQKRTNQNYLSTSETSQNQKDKAKTDRKDKDEETERNLCPALTPEIQTTKTQRQA